MSAPMPSVFKAHGLTTETVVAAANSFEDRVEQRHELGVASRIRAQLGVFVAQKRPLLIYREQHAARAITRPTALNAWVGDYARPRSVVGSDREPTTVV